jgi:hypothetical protein
MSSAAAHVSNNPAAVARRHRSIERFLRIGWFAKGVVYVLAGVLTIAAWLHVRSGDAQAGGEASPQGALESLAGATGGRLLLITIAGGLLVYALWRVLSAIMPGKNDADAVVHRIGYMVSAVLYLSLAVTAITLARNANAARTTNGNSKASTLTADVMSHTAGRWLIGLAGVVTLGAAVYRGVKGARQDVTDELDLTGLATTHRKAIKALGSIGEIGRGIAMALIGFFLLRAASSYDASEATGLDGALRRAMTHTGGGAVVVVTGAGFIAYGLFCLVTFHRRRLEAP